MRASLSEAVLKRNMAKADVKETSIVCIVANSLCKGYDSTEPHGGGSKHGYSRNYEADRDIWTMDLII
jgi:hypothetical protein